MKCPHCSIKSKAKVFETRSHDGQVYRRRICSHCCKTFVTREEAPEGLKMPNETQSRHRIVDPKPKPEQGGVIQSSGAHLQNLWR
jgi:transcriptional regulator NrdR family protein